MNMIAVSVIVSLQKPSVPADFALRLIDGSRIIDSLEKIFQQFSRVR